MKKIFLTIAVLFTVLFTSCNQINEHKIKNQHIQDSIKQARIEQAILDSIRHAEEEQLALNEALNTLKVGSKEIHIDRINKRPGYDVSYLIDSIYTNCYPNAFENDIQKENFYRHVFMDVTSNLDKYLAEIPFKYQMMMPAKNNKYALKFECGKYTTNDPKLRGNIKLSFMVIVITPKNIAENMLNNHLYYINGKCTGAQVTLANGRILTANGSCYNDNTICGDGKCLDISFVMNYKDIQEVN